MLTTSSCTSWPQAVREEDGLLLCPAAGGPAQRYGGPRIGLTVPKALGKAVDRNRIKRRMREAVRRNLALLTAPVDVVLHPRRVVIEMEFAALEREVAHDLSRRCRPAFEAGSRAAPKPELAAMSAADSVLPLLQGVLSPALHSAGFTQCRYLPTCSEYAYVAVSRYGWLRGRWLALRRIAALPSVCERRARSRSVAHSKHALSHLPLSRCRP